ncbi:YeiH family protein [Blastococcus capsensis]|uniref:YeiH family protein n=1 Tax=Blastococcus capsensis TaxID=1564163 RepID=UPI0025407DC2|nr:putative sulfate exporter family transporter [Blastococcus capsensis]MDK3255414.1 putative sulfate exporter family transporter [Blastococcus capsensis]
MTGRAVAEGRALSSARPLLPGLAVVAAAVVAAMSVTALLPTVSSLLVAVALGAIIANCGALRAGMRPGLAFTQRRVLRFGIVLLGLQLAVGDIIGLGASGIGIVVITVVLTFLGSLLLGRLLDVGRDLSVLVASGFSICGAAAVAAVQGVTDSDEEDVALAVALVTVYGTLAMVAFPALGIALRLSTEEYGAWAGAAVHEVAQVVVAGSAVGSTALAVAVVVKLSRVALLAPLVLGLGLFRRCRAAPNAGRPPLVPLFVVGFLLSAGLRSTGLVPDAALDVAATVQRLALTAALFALGTGVRLTVLLGTGRRAMLLGAGSTLLAGGTALIAVLVLL